MNHFDRYNISSSDDDDHENEQDKDLIANKSLNTNISLSHNTTRIRNFPHIEGNFPCFIYIPISSFHINHLLLKK